jgi:hypothetical protein
MPEDGPMSTKNVLVNNKIQSMRYDLTVKPFFVVLMDTLTDHMFVTIIACSQHFL